MGDTLTWQILGQNSEVIDCARLWVGYRFLRSTDYN